MQAKYKRILLKLSGEALAGDKGFGLDVATIQSICKGIKKAHDMGAEIGISTQKLHARGPFALKALTSYKYVLRGDGQVRG